MYVSDWTNLISECAIYISENHTLISEIFIYISFLQVNVQKTSFLFQRFDKIACAFNKDSPTLKSWRRENISMETCAECCEARTQIWSCTLSMPSGTTFSKYWSLCSASPNPIICGLRSLLRTKDFSADQTVVSHFLWRHCFDKKSFKVPSGRPPTTLGLLKYSTHCGTEDVVLYKKPCKIWDTHVNDTFWIMNLRIEI